MMPNTYRKNIDKYTNFIGTKGSVTISTTYVKQQHAFPARTFHQEGRCQQEVKSVKDDGTH